MQKRDSYPAGVPCWVDTAQPDAGGGDGVLRRAVRLGVRGADPPDAGALLRRPPRRPWSRPGSRRGAADGWTTYVGVDGADETARGSATRAGACSRPGRRADPGRTRVCADPSGALFACGRPGDKPGAARQRAGQLELERPPPPDPRGAATFYGAVFGWETRHDRRSAASRRRVGPPRLRRLPRRARPRPAPPPGRRGRSPRVLRRRRLDEPGGARAERVGHVTFAVDDTDAVVERAVELGATIVA